MSILTNVHKSAVYPMVACASTAIRQIAAGAGARLHALGPGTGGDGTAAAAAAAAAALAVLQLAAKRRSWAEPIHGEDDKAGCARAMVPTLAGVLRVDSRWDPSARACLASAKMVCTHCAD